METADQAAVPGNTFAIQEGCPVKIEVRENTKTLFDPGVLPFTMYETALKISDRDATRKKLAYLELQPTGIRPNDKPRMEG